jgi:membrane-associated phospholipid phosphatase
MLALTGAAVALGIAASGGRGKALDEETFRAGNADRGPVADRFFGGTTELGSIWASVAAAGVVAAAGRPRAAGRALAAASLTWLAGQGLKKVSLRLRPYEADPAGTRLLIGPPNATSWPSSHAAVLLSFVTVASRDLGAGRAARTALDGLAAAVGASRTYVGVHYPADVAGGLLLGKAVAAVFDGRR